MIYGKQKTMDSNLIDSEMELINRDVCTSFAYNCFGRGFYETHNAKNFTIKASEEVDQWNLDLFQEDNNNEWVIWFTDLGGDENYFGEFWLIFAEEKRSVAENAYARILDFLKASVERTGKTPPYILENELQLIFNSIWGK